MIGDEHNGPYMDAEATQVMDSIVTVDNAVLRRDRQFCQSRGATKAVDLMVAAFWNSIL